jgi:hypothetical protein
MPGEMTPRPDVLEASVEPTSDAAAVEETLRRYRDAFEQLNAALAGEVWPSVDRAALTKGFGGLRSQRFVFDACDVAFAGSRATASCRGTASHVPKVGVQQPKTEPRHWSFILRKTQGTWIIVRADARP